MIIRCKKIYSGIRLMLVLALASLVVGCAHPIVISPEDTPVRNESELSPRKVAYVMTDADRSLQVTTEGGGGDKVSYFPYRDLEKAVRDALRAVYSDVFVIRSASDADAIKGNNVSLVFAPEIATSSGSSSLFTWPPTRFDIELTCSVTDPDGNMVSRLRVVGNGTAEFSEFMKDFGLSGRRAATDMSSKLKQEISNNPRLR